MHFRRSKHRNKNGSVTSVILLLLVVVALVTAAFSFDYGHGLMMRVQLQAAVDAGALAAAQELAVSPVTGGDTTRAEQYAFDVTGRNVADKIPVSNNSPGNNVTVTINGNAMPRTVTVTATRTTANIFARLIGWNTMPVSATATAIAYKGLSKVKPRQLFPLAVSINWSPPNGAQKNSPLMDYYGPNKKNSTFTIVLNPQNSKNASWLKNWVDKNNPELTFGEDTLIMNGVKATFVQDLKPGDVLNIPLITDGPPFNQDRTVVGVVGFKITKINFPLEIEGQLINPTILKGTPGQTLAGALGQQESEFLEQTAPWVVMLTN